MKALYSQILELIPGLKQSAKEVANVLTLTGVMVDKIEPVEYNGKEDFLFGLEVRQNRPDCLGVVGVAREVAAYFGKKVVLPKLLVREGTKKIFVDVHAKEDVKRVMAVRLENLTNSESPKWLREYIELYGLNSINLLVDLSNWAMLYTGFPNHIFDADKVAGSLVWERSPKNQEFITLGGTPLDLKKDDYLVISDSVGPLVLASSIGGKRSAVSMDTKNIIIEVAVYNPAKLFKDARSLGVVTEAGGRLQKKLAVGPARYAIELLAVEIAKQGKGEIASSIFDYYPKPPKQKPITFKSSLPSDYAGVVIPPVKAVKVLKKLGFKAGFSGAKITAFPPEHRTDIEDEADCVEEILRVIGFNNIPSNEPPVLEYVPDVTPKSTRLIEKLKHQFTAQGFDEVYSLPLTTPELNRLSNYFPWQEVRTQNSINEEYPALRQSLAGGLFEQEKTYLLKNVSHVAIFESGKVFGKTGKKYEEKDVFAGLIQTPDKPLNKIKNHLSAALLSIAAHGLQFVSRKDSTPLFANPQANYNIIINKTQVGVLYTFAPQKLTGNSNIMATAFFELNIDTLISALAKINTQSALELVGKLIVLDANIIVIDEISIENELESVRKKVGSRLWSLEVVDEYVKSGSTKLTIRVSYLGMTDAQAKSLHAKVFN